MRGRWKLFEQGCQFFQSTFFSLADDGYIWAGKWQLTHKTKGLQYYYQPYNGYKKEIPELLPLAQSQNDVKLHLISLYEIGNLQSFPGIINS